MVKWKGNKWDRRGRDTPTAPNPRTRYARDPELRQAYQITPQPIRPPSTSIPRPSPSHKGAEDE